MNENEKQITQPQENMVAGPSLELVEGNKCYRVRLFFKEKGARTLDEVMKNLAGRDMLNTCMA